MLSSSQAALPPESSDPHHPDEDQPPRLLGESDDRPAEPKAKPIDLILKDFNGALW